MVTIVHRLQIAPKEMQISEISATPYTFKGMIDWICCAATAHEFVSFVTGRTKICGQ